jgi:hypothetical protein
MSRNRPVVECSAVPLLNKLFLVIIQDIQGRGTGGLHDTCCAVQSNEDV